MRRVLGNVSYCALVPQSNRRSPAGLSNIGALLLGAVLLSGCTQVVPTDEPITSSQASAASMPAPSTAPALSTEERVIGEAMSGEPLLIPIDNQLVRLTRDDFLSGFREENGREIVGGGPVPRTSFWFVLDPGAEDQATAAWVAHRRDGFPDGVYQHPTDPFMDLVEIIDPERTPEEAERLETALGIDGEGLPAPGTDVSVEVGGILFRLIADAEAVYLVATGAPR